MDIHVNRANELISQNVLVIEHVSGHLCSEYCVVVDLENVCHQQLLSTTVDFFSC